MMYLLYCFLSIVASLTVSSSNQHDVPPPLFPFHCRIPQIRQIHSSSFMYFIHPLFFGRPLFLLSSPHAIIISFSNPFDLILTSHYSQLQSSGVPLHLSFSPSIIFFASSSISSFIQLL